MGFSRQEYWSELPFPSLGELSYQEIKLVSPELAHRFFYYWVTRSAFGFQIKLTIWQWKNILSSFSTSKQDLSFTVNSLSSCRQLPKRLTENYSILVLVKVAQSCPDSLWPLYSPWNSPGRILEWVAFPFSRRSSQPRDWRSLTLQADSLPAEPQGKPRNTGVGSLSLLQQIFPTQEGNRCLLHCRRILYQLSCQGSRLNLKSPLN